MWCIKNVNGDYLTFNSKWTSNASLALLFTYYTDAQQHIRSYGLVAVSRPI